MEQLEILDLAMLGVLRKMDYAAGEDEHRELDKKLKELARLFALEREKQRK